MRNAAGSQPVNCPELTAVCAGSKLSNRKCEFVFSSFASPLHERGECPRADELAPSTTRHSAASFRHLAHGDHRKKSIDSGVVGVWSPMASPIRHWGTLCLRLRGYARCYVRAGRLGDAAAKRGRAKARTTADPSARCASYGMTPLWWSGTLVTILVSDGLLASDGRLGSNILRHFNRKRFLDLFIPQPYL